MGGGRCKYGSAPLTTGEGWVVVDETDVWLCMKACAAAACWLARVGRWAGDGMDNALVKGGSVLIS